MDTIRDMITAQRAELAEILAGLPGRRWNEPSLCAGWRVREVVAHITMPFRYGRGRNGGQNAFGTWVGRKGICPSSARAG